MRHPRAFRLRGLCRTAPQALRRRDGIHPAQPAQGAGRARRERVWHLSDHLTVKHIRAGRSNLRYPSLVSHVAEGLLPYRGLGSGIQRALEEWLEIGSLDDRGFRGHHRNDK